MILESEKISAGNQSVVICQICFVLVKNDEMIIKRNNLKKTTATGLCRVPNRNNIT